MGWLFPARHLTTNLSTALISWLKWPFPPNWGGAAAIRASWPENIRAIKKEVDLPVFGINKIMPKSYDKLHDVIITPTLQSARAVVEAGADIVAVDCTLRQGRTPQAVLDLLQEYKTH